MHSLSSLLKLYKPIYKHCIPFWLHKIVDKCMYACMHACVNVSLLDPRCYDKSTSEKQCAKTGLTVREMICFLLLLQRELIVPS